VGFLSRPTLLASSGVLVVVAVSASGLLSNRGSILLDIIAQLVGGLSATVLCWSTARRADGAERAWRIRMAIGMAGWTTGTAILWLYWSVLHVDVRSLSPAEVGLIILPVMALRALTCFACGSADQSFGGIGRGRIAYVLDTVAIVGSMFAITWFTALGAVVERSAESPVALGVALAYPATNFVPVVFVLLLWLKQSVPRPMRTQLAFLGWGLLAIAVSASVFAYLVAMGRTEVPTVADAGLIVGPILIGRAALAPSHAVARSVSTAVIGERSTVIGERLHVFLPYAVVAVMILLVARRSTDMSIR
jgi:diguanylate cyclase